MIFAPHIGSSTVRRSTTTNFLQLTLLQKNL